MATFPFFLHTNKLAEEVMKRLLMKAESWAAQVDDAL